MSPYEFVQRAQKLIRGGQHQEAVKVCRLGLLAQPKDVEGRLILGSALMALRRYDEVLAEMRVALEVDANSPRALSLKGEALLRKGDAAAAAGILERANALGAGSSVQALLEEAQGAARLSSPFTEAKVPEPGSRPRAPLTDDYLDRDGPTKHYPFRREPGGGDALAKVPSLPVSQPSAPQHAPPDELARGHARWGESPRPERGEGGREGPPIMEDEATVVAQTPGVVAPDDSGALIEVRSADVMHETAQRPTMPERPGPRAAADFDSMFPDDDEGVSRLEPATSDEIEAMAEVASEARNSAPVPAAPAAHSPAPQGSPSPVEPPAAAPGGEDMRTIRAGLGLPAEDSGGFRAHLRAEMTARKPRRESDNAATRARSSAPTKKRGLLLAGYAAIALVILGGAVFAGLQIRDARLRSRVEEAAGEAVSVARADTYAGYVAAAEARERILNVEDTESARAAVARSRAALAFVFGEGLDEARKLAEAVSDSDTVDAMVANALVALKTGDSKTAQTLAKAIAKAGPDTDSPGIADFIAGYASLIEGDAEAAQAAFGRAIAAEDRPRHHMGLARSLAQGGDYQAALTQLGNVPPEHPAAVILKARILAASGEVDAADRFSAMLTEVSAAADVAPAHKQWAKLALAELLLVGGDADAAGEAIAPLADATINDFALAESAAAVFLALGDTASTIAISTRAVAAWPERNAPSVLLARAHVADGNARRALQAFAEAGELAGMPAALAARGRAYLMTGDVEAAAADLDVALEADPSLTAAQVARARVDLARDNAAAAMARLQPLFEADAGPAVTVAYASALARAGKADRARKLLAKVIETGAGWRAHLELARLAGKRGDCKGATDHYRTAIEGKASPALRVEAAEAAFDCGDASGALDLIEATAKSDHAGARALILAARLYGVTGAPDKVEAMLDRAAKKSAAPTWLIARERGRRALANGDAKAAVPSFRASLKARPDNAETWLLLLSAQLALEDGEGAEKTVGEIGEWFPDSAAMALARGRQHYYGSESEDALAAFSLARKRMRKENAPPRRQAVAAYWVGRVHYYTGTLDSAREALTEAIELDPNLSAAYLTLGNVEYGLENFAAAADAYRRVTELAPGSSPDVWFYLGDMATRIGKKKLARRALETYRRRAPKGAYVKEAARLLKSL